MSIFSNRIITEKEWVKHKPSSIEYALSAAARIWYRVVPSFLTTQFSVGSVLGWLVRVSLILFIALVPLIFAKFVAPLMQIPADKVEELTRLAWYQAAVLGVAQILKYTADRIRSAQREEKERARSLLDLSVALDQIVGVISQQIEQLSGRPGAAEQRESMLTHALQCIECTVKLCTDNMDSEYCCVTLLTFEARERAKVTARSRTAGRPVGDDFPQQKTMAYSTARFAEQFHLVNHFRSACRLRKENPLDYRALTLAQPPSYESVLLLPLPATSVRGRSHPVRKGVVTIDSARPYEFLGREAYILTRVQPYLELINLLLSGHMEGIELEA